MISFCPRVCLVSKPTRNLKTALSAWDQWVYSAPIKYTQRDWRFTCRLSRLAVTRVSQHNWIYSHQFYSHRFIRKCPDDTNLHRILSCQISITFLVVALAFIRTIFGLFCIISESSLVTDWMEKSGLIRLNSWPNGNEYTGCV